MIDNNNIILITDNDNIAKSVLKKLILLRDNDNISVCSAQNLKQVLKNSTYCVAFIVQENENEETIIKLINSVKQAKNDIEIILLTQNIQPDLILKAYDNGIYDYLPINADNYEYMIKAVNCFKSRNLKDINYRNEKFLTQLGVIDTKTNLYQQKYLKEIFVDLTNNLRIKNGTFSVLTLDESNKTKVSSNRLAAAVKACIRKDDIAATARGGKYYLILPNIDLIGTKAVLQKIQDKMGENYKIRAGISKIGIRSFDTLEKNSLDGLISATQNNVIAVCLEDNIDIQNTWLDDDENNKKQNYKLFKNVFNSKMENIITPIFYRYQKEYEAKLTNTEVSQYTNNIESVFSLKNEKIHSELIIRYNGYAKFKIEIVHSGLESAENTKMEVPLNKLTDKFLISLLKQLKNEYKQTAYKKG